MNSDALYIRRCFDLARRGAGSVSPNPMVGAILVYQDKIIGEGWHQAWGKAHAEAHCFASVLPENQPLIPLATLYCSLEPCSHFGKTPPCADLIVQHKVHRVVVANTDPNPLVASKGLDKLRANGIDVLSGILEQEGLWLNRFFFTWITQNRPFVILKWAQTADGFLGIPNKRTPISGPLAQRLVHRWRAETDAILVGAGTAIIDDPMLDVRHYFGRHPLRVLLDGNGRVPLDRAILADNQPTLIFGPVRAGMPVQKKFIPLEGAVTVPSLLEVLRNENRATLLVEGGAQVLGQFINQGIWDEIRTIQSPLRLGNGIEAPKLPASAVLREQFHIGTDLISFFSND